MCIWAAIKKKVGTKKPRCLLWQLEKPPVPLKKENQKLACLTLYNQFHNNINTGVRYCVRTGGLNCNVFYHTSPFCPHLGVWSCLCIPESTTPPPTSLGCLPPFTVAGKQLPPSHLYLHCSSPLFTLRSSALAHCAPNSCSIMGNAGAQTAQRHHTALSDSPPWLREHAFHCCHKAQSPPMPEWLPGAAWARATVRDCLQTARQICQVQLLIKRLRMGCSLVVI